MAWHRPLIGVTGSAEGGRAMWWWTRFALWLAGARTTAVTTRRAVAVAGLDGLVIGGGDDIGAALYHGDVTLNVRIDPERDALEQACLEDAEARGLPVLGICRGAQMMNVTRGGNLTQDIYARYAGLARMRTALPRKRVRVRPHSRLGRILGVTGLTVNALHHQAMDRLGRGLQVVAEDEHGMAQAVEGEGPRFFVGVQWHPEFLLFSPVQRRLFAALTAAAREKCS